MNAINPINHALVSHGLLPMDGSCVCTECLASGLNRDQINIINHFDRVCDTCRPLYASDRQSPCTCGHDRINHSGPWGFVECFHCAQKPSIADVSKPCDADAYFDLMDDRTRIEDAHTGVSS